MKVVACEKCGAKYQIDDSETVDNYECSVCAGNLKEVEEYPSTYASINQNHGNSLYQNLDNSNSQIVYCESCGLKYNLHNNEYAEDYECSSCFGNLRYIDEDLNKNLEKRLKLRQESANNSKTDSSSSSQDTNLMNQRNVLDSEANNLKNQNNASYLGSNINSNPNSDFNNNSNINNNKNNINRNNINNNNINENNINNNLNNSNPNTNLNINGNNNNTNSNTNSNINSNLNSNINPNDNPNNNNKINNKININNNYKSNTNSNSNMDSNTDSNINPHSNSNLTDSNPESTAKFESNVISPINEMNVNKIEKKLRREIKNEFSQNLAHEYGIDEPILRNETSNETKVKAQNIEDEIKKNIEKDSKTSIFDRIANRGQKGKKEKKGKKEDNLPEDIAIEKEIAELNKPSKTVDDEINELIKKDNTKQELVPYPNIENTSYHDFYIVAGLILVLIGFADILLSLRIYSVIFIAIGFVLFIIGIIKNKNYKATEKRGKLIREKLLTLPENFYVLYFVKAPNSNAGINHVVVGASGIFAIVSQSYNEKEDKEKPKTDSENLNLVTKSKLDNLDILGISDVVEQANNNYENNRKKEEEANQIEEKKPTIGKFKFRETPIKFEHNNKIKQKSIQLSEELIDFLNENGLSNCYVEPLVGFVNKDVAVINMPLTDEDLFLDELLYKIVHGKRQLDDITTHKVAVLLSQYSTECSS